MSLDSFTAACLLNAAASDGDINQIVDLGKSLQGKGDGGPSTEARNFFVQNHNKKCKIKFTSHEGVIFRLNEAISGFYPGSRYPIKVQITNGEAKGAIFEYDLDQIELIEE